MPILDVIVSKTMDQALLEVEDEVEMERIMGHLVRWITILSTIHVEIFSNTLKPLLKTRVD